MNITCLECLPDFQFEPRLSPLFHIIYFRVPFWKRYSLKSYHLLNHYDHYFTPRHEASRRRSSCLLMGRKAPNTRSNASWRTGMCSSKLTPQKKKSVSSYQSQRKDCTSRLIGNSNLRPMAAAHADLIERYRLGPTGIKGTAGRL